MNRIAQAFAGGKAFIAFLTAGDPSLEKSCEYILEMERAGADLVEIGIPFSDPIFKPPIFVPLPRIRTYGPCLNSLRWFGKSRVFLSYL